MDARACDSDLARYTEFLWEEEERLVEHAKSLTAAVAAAHAASEARNQEIYEENHRFQRGRLEWQRVFKVSVAEAAVAAGTVLQLSSSLVGSSSSASYRARSAEERQSEVVQSPSAVVLVFRGYFVQFI